MTASFQRRHAFTARAKPDAMRRMVRRGVVLLLCLALGMQWVLVQGVAWTEMLIEFASEGSVIEAVEKTFDGKHPCPLCAKVKEGNHEASGKKAPREDDSTKDVDAVLVTHPVLVPPAAEVMTFAALHEVPAKRMETPEPPPPRRGLV